MEQLNFEKVNREIEDLDLAELEKSIGQKIDGYAPQALALPDICKIWKSIGSIVKLVAQFPFLPKKWRAALDLLIKTMDGLC